MPFQMAMAHYLKLLKTLRVAHLLRPLVSRVVHLIVSGDVVGRAPAQRLEESFDFASTGRLV